MQQQPIIRLFLAWEKLRAREDCSEAECLRAMQLERDIAGTPARTFAELQMKMRVTLAMTEDGCDEQAAGLLQSALLDLDGLLSAGQLGQNPTIAHTAVSAGLPPVQAASGSHP